MIADEPIYSITSKITTTNSAKRNFSPLGAPPLLGPRASRPHRVRVADPTACLGKAPWFRKPSLPVRSSAPAQSRQDAGAPSVRGSRHTAFQVAKT